MFMRDVAGMPDFVFWALSLGGTAACLFGLLSGFRALHRARLIEDVPTARVRSAPQGYVELVGRAEAMQGEPIFAPLSGTRCCWYRYRIDERDDNNWATQDSGVSDDLFLLRDDTGECVIDVDGAEITSSHKEVWYSDTPFSGAGGLHQRGHAAAPLSAKIAGASLKLSGSPLGLNARYRFVEEVVLGGDPLYVIGYFRSLDDIDHQAHQQTLSTEILRDWKQRPDTLRERFDNNRDGIIDAEEWDRARAAAALQANQEYAALAQGQHLHTMSKPVQSGLAYLISNVPEFELVRGYRKRALWRLAIFFVAGAAVTWMFSQRFLFA